jgi:hypothetical protein
MVTLMDRYPHYDVKYQLEMRRRRERTRRDVRHLNVVTQVALDVPDRALQALYPVHIRFIL